MGSYKPGWESRDYHQLSPSQRAEIVRKVNALFRKQTGVTRSLHPSSANDRELRNTWLQLRDSVVEQREEALASEERELRRDLLVDVLPWVVIDDMKYEGWTAAAEIFETWAKRPSSPAPRYSAPVTHVIKMDWLLGFARAKLVYDQIHRERIWTNEASRERISQILRKKPRRSGQTFGDLSQPVTVVDEEWINARPVLGGAYWDALAGALGAFVLQIAIAGRVASASGAVGKVVIEEVGVYVKDSFDFEGSQFLGFWGDRDDPVNNGDFREWRQKSGMGGDFWVFSDVKPTKLPSPDVVEVRL
jgi:Family of unknown function (DUF6402)